MAVESLILKIIVTTIATDRAGSEESTWLSRSSYSMVNLRNPCITNTVDAQVNRTYCICILLTTLHLISGVVMTLNTA